MYRAAILKMVQPEQDLQQRVAESLARFDHAVKESTRLSEEGPETMSWREELEDRAIRIEAAAEGERPPGMCRRRSIVRPLWMQNVGSLSTCRAVLSATLNSWRKSNTEYNRQYDITKYQIVLVQQSTVRVLVQQY